MYEITLFPPAPYDFSHLFERLRHSSNWVLYRMENDSITRLFLVDGHPVLVKLTSTGTVEQPQVKLAACNATNEQQAKRAFAYCRHVFSLDRPLAPFYAAIEQNDPVLFRLVQQHRGIHMLLEPGVYEAMILSIIGQQVNMTFAANLKHELVKLCNQSFEWKGQTFYAFPSPERVASLSYEDLRKLKYSQRKAEYVIDFARLVADGRFPVDEISRMSNEQAIEEMVKLRGIGRWTAECVLLFGLGRPDILPALDIGLRNAMQLFYGLDRQPSEQEVRQMATRWRGWESYVTYYLWTALGIAKQRKQEA
ncbi:DNA-3-methyladenine glycosylase family protein [Effusibacillus pohliae]|uniref:DNA-3-methyladenine glycosylase family protein n=1 Tax=Effusibacillus pohliae TaxID=232270 RepID=UPI00036AB75C|nr:DNA-3-methyladenine glycosylase [Effusibacillus pohliae]